MVTIYGIYKLSLDIEYYKHFSFKQNNVVLLQLTKTIGKNITQNYKIKKKTLQKNLFKVCSSRTFIARFPYILAKV